MNVCGELRGQTALVGRRVLDPPLLAVSPSPFPPNSSSLPYASGRRIPQLGPRIPVTRLFSSLSARPSKASQHPDPTGLRPGRSAHPFGRSSLPSLTVVS